MGKTYTVRSGDTLSRIAAAQGLANWQELYYATENADFRARRPDPNLIQPGDVLSIPDPSTASIGDAEDEPFDEPHFEESPENEPAEEAATDFARTEADATAVFCVCRNEWNTFNTRPAGHHWFSA